MSILDDARRSLDAIEKDMAATQVLARNIGEHVTYLRHLVDSADTGAPDPAPPPVEPDPPPMGETPPSGIHSLLSGRVHIWRENSSASNLGYTHSVVFARRGVAGPTVRTYTLIMAAKPDQPNPSWFTEWARTARREGCIAVAIDLESYFMAEGPEYCSKVSAACRMVLPLIWVPVMSSSGSSYHIGSNWGMNISRQAAWFNATCDGCLFWKYNLSADKWIEAERIMRRHGLTVPFYNLSDWKRREDHTPLTDRDVAILHAAGKSIGGFLSSTNNYDRESIATPTGRQVASLYT